MLRRMREFFFGRPMTNKDIFEGRLRLCAAAGLKPDQVGNFWVGIEELRPTSTTASRPEAH